MSQELPPISQELVPASYDRQSLAFIHGNELPGHHDALTIKQAEAINENYAIVIALGDHGQGIEPGQAKHPDDVETLDISYGQVEDLAGEMKPGDVLLVEGAGYTKTGEDAPDHSMLEVESMLRDLANGPADGPGQQFLNGMATMLAGRLANQPGWRQAYSDKLQALKSNHEIDAWDYAIGLAVLRGVKVKYADIDVAEKARTDELQRMAFTSKIDGAATDEDGLVLSQRIRARRDRATANIVKDEALAGLSDAITQRENLGGKPLLAVLRGTYHAETILKAFDDLKLHVDNVVELERREGAPILEDQRRLEVAVASGLNESNPHIGRMSLLGAFDGIGEQEDHHARR